MVDTMEGRYRRGQAGILRCKLNEFMPALVSLLSIA